MIKKKRKLKPLKERKADDKSDYWKKKADGLWGRIIHYLFDGCAINGDCAGNLEAHHLITRSNKVTRHDIRNGIKLCSRHHKYCQKLSAHGAPFAFVEWMQENRPEQSQWVSENKFRVGSYNYREAYESLQAWCEENGPHLLED